MKNLETPTTKLALYGALGSIGNALMVEALHRQYETTAVLDDLNAINSRPGIRAKSGNLFEAVSVSQSVAGMDAVICVLASDHLDAGASNASAAGAERLSNAVTALLDGLVVAGVKRLLLIGDFNWMEHPSAVGEYIQQRLTGSPVAWTLVEAPEVADDLLQFDELTQPAREPGGPVDVLQRFAAGALDELELCLHVHCRLHLIDQQ